MFRWGILGLGRIANKFAFELNQTKLGKVAAVGSRDLEKAREFANLFGGESYGSYTEFIERAQVDAVYIAVPHHLHFELTQQCLLKGIPVLCEKPFTINKKQLESLVQIAKTKQVFLMEAMWTRFMPHILWIKEQIDAGKLGTLLHLKAEFSFQGKARGIQEGVSRLIDNSLGGGALLDIGIYPVFLSQLLFGKPTNIAASAQIVNHIDEVCMMQFSYSNGSTANLESSILWEADGQAVIYGQNATINIPRKWHESNELVVTYADKSHDYKKWDYPSRGFYYEMKEVQDAVQSGKKESQLMPLQFSLDMMDTLDKIRSIIGLQYPADKE